MTRPDKSTDESKLSYLKGLEEGRRSERYYLHQLLTSLESVRADEYPVHTLVVELSHIAKLARDILPKPRWEKPESA